MLLVRFCRGDPDRGPSCELQICYVDRETALPIYHHLNSLSRWSTGDLATHASHATNRNFLLSMARRSPCSLSRHRTDASTDQKFISIDRVTLELRLCHPMPRSLRHMREAFGCRALQRTTASARLLWGDSSSAALKKDSSLQCANNRLIFPGRDLCSRRPSTANGRWPTKSGAAR